MVKIKGIALYGDLDGPGDLFFRDAVEGRLFLIDGKDLAVAFRLPEPIDIDHPGRSGEDLFHLCRQFYPGSIGWPIDLGDQGLQYRRAGRHLGHRHSCPVFGGNLRQRRANPGGDIVALQVAGVFRLEIDLDIGDGRAAAHEIVADQAVEIIGRGGADIDLVIGDRRVLADDTGHLQGYPGGLLKG